MTFSFRKLLFAAPVLVVAGIAAAGNTPGLPCTSPTAGSCPSGSWTPAPKSVVFPSNTPSAQAPAGYYYEPVTNGQGQTAYVMRCTYAAQAAKTTLSAASGKIQVQTADGGKMNCEKLEFLINGVGPLAVTVADGAVQVTTGKEVKDGSFVQASAQKVSRMGPDGATLVLEGSAKLLYSRKGKKIDVATDLLQVNLSTGQVISELEMQPVKPLRPDAPTPPIELQTGPATPFPRGTTADPRESGPDRDPRP